MLRQKAPMTQDRVMLLIDADNVSLDVIEQAVRLLLNQHGGLHVRRAYCTAESAVKHQAAFKRLGIKPMVNLAAGKNSTDIALAVDAIDLVLSERPEVVVIASSDSDFAPLVQRLREKGCVVRGIGQQGKTGDETQDVYDDYTVLEHHKPAASARRTDTADKPARAARAPRKTAVAKVPAAKKTAAAKKVAPGAKPVDAPAKAAARKAPARKAAPVAEPIAFVASPPAPALAPAATRTAVPLDAGRAASRRGGASVQAVLACLPELQSGQGLALNVAVQRLREAQLLGKNSSSLKLFAQLADHFDLTPLAKPTQVRLR
jgi:uncharacterized protein (TIGR00288 family)